VVRRRGFLVLPVLGLSGLLAVVVPTTVSASRPVAARGATRSPWGWIHAEGTRLVDRQGRVVVFHGVNAVEKRAPYELTATAGRPNSFTEADASHIAALGFDVVRLGIIWQGMEPSTVGPNSPQICGPGPPDDPVQPDPSVMSAYLDQVARVVALLAGHHVYTLLDMHEDIDSSVFGGEGAPPWAVCTDDKPVLHPPGRWSHAYSEPALDAAEDNFWTNDVRGDLQGSFIDVWRAVASRFRENPAVLGYDLMNEPFSPSLVAGPAHVTASAHAAGSPHTAGSPHLARSSEVVDSPQVAVELECSYTGTAHPARQPGSTAPLPCPADDPAVGLVPAIEQVDPNHLLFVEPDIYGGHHHGDTLTAMDFPRLVFNFHVYCGDRSPVTGNPLDLARCAREERRALVHRTAQRARLASAAQHDGPPDFLSEFGATHDAALDQQLTAQADRLQLSWTTWTWRSYDDPTGSADEALIEPNGASAPELPALAQPYPQAVAGDPVAFAFDAATDRFTLTYRAEPVRGPTVVFVPVSIHYPLGYCAHVSGGTVLSRRGADHLVVGDDGHGLVSVSVSPGTCAAF
jgi:endoglycosylceramidase